MSTKGVNVYEREKLYKEVWNTPVIQVAKRYGVSNVAIKKICKSMNIPTPPNGYWAKLRNGKEVHITPLPPVKSGQEIKYGMDPDAMKKKKGPLQFLDSTEQEKHFTVALVLKVDQNKKLCTEIKDHQSIVDRWNKVNPSMEGLHCSIRDYGYRHSVYTIDRHERPPVLAGVISKSGLTRAYHIINELIEGIKHLGYSVNEDMSFQIRGEKVEFYIYEKQSYFKHIVTSEEIIIKERYKKEKGRNQWAQEPYIPSEDYLFNGKLLFCTKKATYIQDTDELHIEDRISDMFIQLIQQSEVLRLERRAKEEAKCKKEEEWLTLNDHAINYNNEIDKLTLLLNEASEFEIAMKIRAYVNHVQQKDFDNKNSEFINWASKKADWYDPSMSMIDDIFGLRDHNSEFTPTKKNLSYRGF